MADSQPAGPPVSPPGGSSRWRDKEFMLVMLLLLVIIITSGLIITITIVSQQKPKCPASCDDGNPCTVDYCNGETGECVQTAIDGNSGTCSGPAGECKTKTCDSGSCVERTEEGCCGNGECEENESCFTCLGDCPPPEFERNSTDGIDNDMDGLTDCKDPDCNCTENCTDGVDNDKNGLADCADPDCDCGEDCDNGVDDNEDGLVDCCDPECRQHADCEEDCDDEKDNDCDDKVDCDDGNCEENEMCKMVCGHEDFIMINEFISYFGHGQMGEWEDECEAVPQGEFRGKVNEVSCYTNTNPYINCTAVENETRFIELEEFCEELKAKWRCQNNYLGCLCNKKPPAEVEEIGCEDAPVSDPDDWFECTKYDCPNGDECSWDDNAKGCICQGQNDCGWHLEEPDNPDSRYCDGGCPEGQLCAIVGNGHWSCECVTDLGSINTIM